jgi:hypothetical protein
MMLMMMLMMMGPSSLPAIGIAPPARDELRAAAVAAAARASAP